MHIIVAVRKMTRNNCRHVEFRKFCCLRSSAHDTVKGEASGELFTLTARSTSRLYPFQLENLNPFRWVGGFFLLHMNSFSSPLFHELAWIHPESSWHRFTRTAWAEYFKISSHGEFFCSYQHKLGLKVLETMKLDSALRIYFVKMSKSPTEVRW